MSKKVTRIGVLSDTHYHKFDEVPNSLLESIKKFDMIIHLGDFVSKDLVEHYKSFNNFYGIAGNHDPQSVKKMLPKTDVIEINGKRLGLLHGYWFPFFCQDRSLARFKKDKVDAILYGHTHIIRNELAKNILFFNPGSVCGRFPAMHRSYGILTVGDEITSEIVTIEEKKYYYLHRCINLASKAVSYCCGLNKSPDSI